MRSAIGAGTRRGRQHELSDKCCAGVGGKQRVSSVWTVPFGSSSCGEYGCIGCLTPLLLLPSLRRLRPAKSNQRLILALAIPGTNLFSDGLLPPLSVQQRWVQKNETHPYPCCTYSSAQLGQRRPPARLESERLLRSFPRLLCFDPIGVNVATIWFNARLFVRKYCLIQSKHLPICRPSQQSG